MRMEGWAIHGSNQAMKQWARAWQRQQRNLTLILNVLATGLIGKAKKKKKSFVLASVHSDGSVGHRVSRVFCLIWGSGFTSAVSLPGRSKSPALGSRTASFRIP